MPTKLVCVYSAMKVTCFNITIVKVDQSHLGDVLRKLFPTSHILLSLSMISLPVLSFLHYFLLTKVKCGTKCKETSRIRSGRDWGFLGTGRLAS